MKILIALMVLFLCSCQASNSMVMDKDAEQAERGMVFIKHHQSGLCFAYVWQGGTYGGPAIANVPCEKVENLLGPKPKKCQGGQK
jgi:hypothetical protein